MIDTSSLWPWISLALLGGFHGLNPAMGWLFAVARGLQERKATAVVAAIGPISVGHALAIACIAIPFGLLQVVVPASLMMILGGTTLITYALYKVATRFRHPRWVGMRINGLQLTLWSMLMAAVHGAGLMLIPALAGLTTDGPAATMASSGHAHHSHLSESGTSLAAALAAVAVHTLAMILVMGFVAIVVYQWVGVEVLRRAWINLDLLWTAVLVLAGLFTIGLGVYTI